MSTVEDWVAAASAELGLDPAACDIRLVLDLARDAAHGVERPAAPLTSFLLGLAVGQGQSLPDCAGRLQALAGRWRVTQ